MSEQPVSKQQWIEFHNILSSELAIPVSVVSTVRTLVLDKRLSRKDIALWAADKLHLSGKYRRYSKAHYQPILDFTASATDAQWTSLLREYIPPSESDSTVSVPPPNS
jgi:hypothetical protein